MKLLELLSIDVQTLNICIVVAKGKYPDKSQVNY
jgi:hypothetical protein